MEAAFTLMTLRKYKNGFLLMPPKEHIEWGIKYYHGGFWNETLRGWIFNPEYYDFLIECGAKSNVSTKATEATEATEATRVNDIDDSAEYLKEEDYINIEPPVNKKKKRKLKLKHNSVDKQIETFFKTSIEKCDDGYISLDYLKDDYAKYCFYKGVPRDRHFIELVNEKLSKPQKIYVDGQKFTHLIWGYKFKPVEYDV